MKRVERLPDDKIYAESARELAIANEAVRAAQAETRRLGLPHTFWKAGRVWYELPNGAVTDVRPASLGGPDL